MLVPYHTPAGSTEMLTASEELPSGGGGGGDVGVCVPAKPSKSSKASIKQRPQNAALVTPHSARYKSLGLRERRGCGSWTRRWWQQRVATKLNDEGDLRV